jgi:hypothetical protein
MLIIGRPCRVLVKEPGEKLRGMLLLHSFNTCSSSLIIVCHSSCVW